MQTLKFIVLTSALAALAGPLLAQTAAPRPATPASEAAISERARRDAASPMYWIRVHSERAPDERKGAVPPRPDNTAKSIAAPVSTANNGKSPAAATSPPVANPLVNQGGEPPTGATAAAVPPPVAVAADSAAATVPVPASPAATELKVASLQAAPPPVSPPALALPAPEPEPVAEALVLMSGGEPRFPDALMRRLRRGTVTMRVDVDTDGQVRHATVLTSSHPRLEAAATEAAQAMRFQPVRRPASADINFSFDLDL